MIRRRTQLLCRDKMWFSWFLIHVPVDGLHAWENDLMGSIEPVDFQRKRWIFRCVLAGYFADKLM